LEGHCHHRLPQKKDNFYKALRNRGFLFLFVPMLTLAALTTRMYVAAAQQGVSRNNAPSDAVWQMWSFVQDITLSVANDDTVREAQLLSTATDKWGRLPTSLS